MAGKSKSKTAAKKTTARSTAPAATSDTDVAVQPGAPRPTANEMRAELEGWFNAQVAAGADLDELKSVVADYEPAGTAAGVIDEAMGPAGQWGTRTYPADWEPGEPALA